MQRMRLPNQYENMIAMTTLDYIEQQYRTATLTEALRETAPSDACVEQNDPKKHRI